MGFFSSRAEQLHTSLHDDNPVSRVIRTRFYGKSKGKERDVDPDPLTPSLSTSTLFTRAEKRSFSSIRHTTAAGTSMRTSHWANSSATVPPSPARRTDHAAAGIPQSRSSTDVITVTLAQRLNELATANSEGLLSDDEYRLLRQNLFERFASGSAVPSETPLVRMTAASQSTADARTSFNASHDRRTSSHFHVQSTRTPSVTSKRSFTTTVTSLLRRATSKHAASNLSEYGSDTMSVYSMASTTAARSPKAKTLTKQSSDGSIRPNSSRIPTTRRRELSAEDADTGRVARGRKRSGSAAPPPSSFHGPPAGLGFDSYTHIDVDVLPSDENVESLQDIRNQIELVEAEGRRLLDAFNGLELSTLTRRKHRPPVIPPLALGNGEGMILSPSFLDRSSSFMERRSVRAGKDIDSLSFKSNGSVRTNPSMKHTPSFRKMRTTASSSTLVSQPSGVPRKGSVSSMSSRGRPAMPSLAALASSSSVNLTRSSNHLPLATVAETEGKGRRVQRSEADGDDMSYGSLARASVAEDEDYVTLEAELADIRRRREEVTARYDERLEYLRARLKGAELREKLLRK